MLPFHNFILEWRGFLDLPAPFLGRGFYSLATVGLLELGYFAGSVLLGDASVVGALVGEAAIFKHATLKGDAVANDRGLLAESIERGSKEREIGGLHAPLDIDGLYLIAGNCSILQLRVKAQ